jgi:hypothetical protein
MYSLLVILHLKSGIGKQAKGIRLFFIIRIQTLMPVVRDFYFI